MHRLWNVPLPLPPREENQLILARLKQSFERGWLVGVDVDMQYQLGRRR